MNDLESYGRLVARYQGLVFGVAFHLLGNVEDARDVAQDVFIRAFTRLSQVRDEGKIGSWLRQITVNECRAHLAKKRPALPLSESHASDDRLGLVEDRVLLSRALGAIDETSRLTVILFYLHAYSLKEIGSFLDEPVTTIKSRLRNARMKLRKEMEDVLDRNLGPESLPEDFAERVTRLIKAAQAGDALTIRALLEEDPDLLSAREEPGSHTALHVAAASGNAAVVELLLSYGADPNALDTSDNANPLHYAAERGWLDCVKLLVEAGADVNWDRNVHERGPLGWAVIFGTVQREVADYLMAHGARLDIFSATALGDIEGVRRIVSENPEALLQRMSDCERRLSPVEFATSHKQPEIARLLVDLGAEVGLNEAAALGMTSHMEMEGDIDYALKAAVQAGQLATTRILIEKGGDPNFAPQGTSLIFDSIAANDEPMTRLLLDLGADLEFKDDHWKSSALGWEVFFGRVEGVRLALKLGAKIGPNFVELAEEGMKGALKRFSSGQPKDYQLVHEILMNNK